MTDVDVIYNLSQVYADLYTQEQKVADYIIKHPKEVTAMSVMELAESSSVSEATVMRLSKKAGCEGFYHFKISLARTIHQNQILNSFSIDLNDMEQSIQNSFNLKVEELNECAMNIDYAAIQAALQMIKSANNLYIFAVGNTNPVAMYASYQFTQYGIQAVTHSTSELQISAAMNMTEDDVCLLLSDSGDSFTMNNIAEIAKERGVTSILITSYPGSNVAQIADHVLQSFTSEKVVFQGVSSSRLTHLAIIDVLVLLLSHDESGNYEALAKEKEAHLLEYKKVR